MSDKKIQANPGQDVVIKITRKPVTTTSVARRRRGKPGKPRRNQELDRRHRPQAGINFYDVAFVKVAGVWTDVPFSIDISGDPTRNPNPTDWASRDAVYLPEIDIDDYKTRLRRIEKTTSNNIGAAGDAGRYAFALSWVESDDMTLHRDTVDNLPEFTDPKGLTVSSLEAHRLKISALNDVGLFYIWGTWHNSYNKVTTTHDSTAPEVTLPVSTKMDIFPMPILGRISTAGLEKLEVEPRSAFVDAVTPTYPTDYSPPLAYDVVPGTRNMLVAVVIINGVKYYVWSDLQGPVFDWPDGEI